MAINTKISLCLLSYPRRLWNRISSLLVLLVKLFKCFLLIHCTIVFRLKDTLLLWATDNTDSSKIPIQTPIITDSRCYGHHLMVWRSSTQKELYFSTKILWRKATVDVNTFLRPPWEIVAENRSVECDYYYYYYYYYHCYYCYYYYCCCCCRWWYFLFGLLVLRTYISSLLQSVTSVITKCDRYYKVRHNTPSQLIMPSSTH